MAVRAAAHGEVLAGHATYPPHSQVFLAHELLDVHKDGALVSSSTWVVLEGPYVYLHAQGSGSCPFRIERVAVDADQLTVTEKTYDRSRICTADLRNNVAKWRPEDPAAAAVQLQGVRTATLEPAVESAQQVPVLTLPAVR